VRPDSGSIRIGDVDAGVSPGAAKARMGVQLQSTSFQSDLTIPRDRQALRRPLRVPLAHAGIDEPARRRPPGEEASKRFSQCRVDSRNASHC